MRLAEVDPGLPVGSIVAVEIDAQLDGQLDGGPMTAIRTAQGWVLTPDRCPHAQCPFSLDGELADDGTLICNCHGSEFDPVSGALLQGPAAAGIAVVPLRVERNTLNFEPR